MPRWVDAREDDAEEEEEPSSEEDEDEEEMDQEVEEPEKQGAEDEEPGPFPPFMEFPSHACAGIAFSLFIRAYCRKCAIHPPCNFILSLCRLYLRLLAHHSSGRADDLQPEEMQVL